MGRSKLLLNVVDFILHLLGVFWGVDSFLVDYTGDLGSNFFLGLAFRLGSTPVEGVVALFPEPLEQDIFRASSLLSSNGAVVPPRKGLGGRHRFVTTLGAHDLDVLDQFGEVRVLVFTGEAGKVHALWARRLRAWNNKDIAGGGVFAHP